MLEKSDKILGINWGYIKNLILIVIIIKAKTGIKDIINDIINNVL